MERETVNVEQIKMLNQLKWDKKIYAYCYGNGVYFLEVNYYHGDYAYRYKVICADEAELHRLRAELDTTTKLVELHDGRKVSVSNR